MDGVRYYGWRCEDGCVVVKFWRGKWVPLPLRSDVWNHSPEGFEWGYGGSGPAQLALAILCDVAGPEVAAERHQDFKREMVGKFPRDRFTLAVEDVWRWLRRDEDDLVLGERIDDEEGGQG